MSVRLITGGSFPCLLVLWRQGHHYYCDAYFLPGDEQKRDCQRVRISASQPEELTSEDFRLSIARQWADAAACNAFPGLGPKQISGGTEAEAKDEDPAALDLVLLRLELLSPGSAAYVLRRAKPGWLKAACESVLNVGDHFSFGSIPLQD